ncbi:DUF5025 domain-containing protein [Pedobacter sp. PLR]|uniref:DUF5025 domain-containing protein n=1 Tax=Pedobacter sp. PLR TaxID=2994465 RepID=UPI00224865B4|nr:DUF5025 domain-containing protein [Pedobacter sp. PLR]MCX2450124.1 DUF5025 domain-containing protein [Pedobacter sp. PLR]
MNNNKANTYLSVLLCLMIGFSLSSCTKEQVQQEEKQAFTQYFKGTVGTQAINVRNTLRDDDRSQLQGSWSGLDIAIGNQIEIYTVNVKLPKELLNTTNEAKLRFQINNIQKKQYQINVDDPYETDFGTFIYLMKNPGLDNQVIYQTSSLKKPFNIEITKYEFPNGDILPMVGGKLNGVLYNEKNLMDSVVIQNGDFEVWR